MDTLAIDGRGIFIPGHPLVINHKQKGTRLTSWDGARHRLLK